MVVSIEGNVGYGGVYWEAAVDGNFLIVAGVVDRDGGAESIRHTSLIESDKVS
jgi:hypothetical protein